MVSLVSALDFVLGACAALFGGEAPRQRARPLDPVIALCRVYSDGVRGQALPIVGLLACVFAAGALARVGRQKGAFGAASALAAAALLLASSALALAPVLCPAISSIGSADALPALSLQGGPGLATATAGLALTALQPPLATTPKDVLAQLLCIAFYVAWGAPELRIPTVAAGTAADLLAILSRPLQPFMALVGADAGVAAAATALVLASVAVTSLRSTAAAARSVGAVRIGALALLCCLALDGGLRLWLPASIAVGLFASRFGGAAAAGEEEGDGPSATGVALGSLGLPWTALALAQWAGVPVDVACAGAAVAVAISLASFFLWPRHTSSSSLARAAFFQASLAITDAALPPSFGSASGAARFAAAALAASAAAQGSAAPSAALVLRAAFALAPLSCAAYGLDPAVCGATTAAAAAGAGLLLALLPLLLRYLARPAQALTLAVAVLATAPHAVQLVSAAAAAQGLFLAPLPGADWLSTVAVASDVSLVAGTLAMRTRPAMPAFTQLQPCLPVEAGENKAAPWWSRGRLLAPAFETGDAERVSTAPWCPVLSGYRPERPAAPPLPLHHALDAEQTLRRVLLAHRAADAAHEPGTETAVDVVMALAGLHLALAAVRAWALGDNSSPPTPRPTKAARTVQETQPQPSQQAKPAPPQSARTSVPRAYIAAARGEGRSGPSKPVTATATATATATKPSPSPSKAGQRSADRRGRVTRRRSGSSAPSRPSVIGLDSDVSDAPESSEEKEEKEEEATPPAQREPVPPTTSVTSSSRARTLLLSGAPWSDPRSAIRGSSPETVTSSRSLVRRRRRHRTPQPSLSPEPL